MLILGERDIRHHRNRVGSGPVILQYPTVIFRVLVFLQHALVHGRLAVPGKVVNPVVFRFDHRFRALRVHFVHGKRSAAVHVESPLAASAGSLEVLHLAGSGQGICQTQLRDHRLVGLCRSILCNQMIDDASVLIGRNLGAHRFGHEGAVQIAPALLQKGDIGVGVKCVLPVVVSVAVGLVPKSQRILCNVVDVRVFIGPVGSRFLFLPLEGGSARVACENIFGQAAGDIHGIRGGPRVVDHRVADLGLKGHDHLIAVCQVVVRQRYHQILNSLAVVNHTDLIRLDLRTVHAHFDRVIHSVYADGQPVYKDRSHHLAADRFAADIFQRHGVGQLVAHLDIAGSGIRGPGVVGYVQPRGNGGNIRLQHTDVVKRVSAHGIFLVGSVA